MKASLKHVVIGAFTILVLLANAAYADTQPPNPPVKVSTEGLKAQLSNGIVSISFNESGSAVSLIKDGVDLLKNVKENTFYLSYNTDKFGGLSPTDLKIVRQTDDLAEIAYISTANPLYFELHYVLKRDDSGIYSFLVAKNNKGPLSLGELRTVYRMDRNMLDHAYNEDRGEGEIPFQKDLKTYPLVQDTTWELPDGSIWSKYDWAGFLMNDHVHGHYGNGFGFWMIPVTRDYYNGGPMKQELLVHHDALLLNMLYGAHFGTGSVTIPTGWEKLYGPWFLYINSGTNLVDDAKKQAALQEKQAPFQWMANELYPTARGNVKGKLHVTNGTLPNGAIVSLAKPNQELMLQNDYIFYVKTAQDGSFEIPGVRPGTYTLYAFANGGTITDQLEVDDVKVGSTNLDLGTVEWTQPAGRKLLWQIGTADRKAAEFNLGNQPRQYGLTYKVPETLTYTIGKNKPAEDWYFAQSAIGDWNINFTFNPKDAQGDTALLTIAIASVARGPVADVLVNGTKVGTLNYKGENDQSTYRCANSAGRYRLREFKVPLSLLKAENTITLSLNTCPEKGGIMYDTIKLESTNE